MARQRHPMKPYWLVRTLSGISMDLGITLLVYNLARTVLEPAPRLVRGEPTSIEPLRPGEVAP